MSSQPARWRLYVASTLFWLGFALSTVIFCVPVMLTRVLPPRRRYEFVNHWVGFNIWWLRVTCGIDYRVIGAENIVEPAIVFAKHQSTWETLALKLIFPHSVYVAKRELRWVPFFGWAFAALDYIYINRSAGKSVMPNLIAQAKTKIANGFSITIFPEGTRSAVGAEPNYKIGGAFIAAETGAPVLPVAHDAGVYWPRHSFLKHPGTIVISIGLAIESTDQTATQIRDQAQQWIEAEMQRLLASNALYQLQQSATRTS